MTTSQKAALSLLITVILFGAFTALAFTGLFNLIETRFYNPSITSSIRRDIDQNADTVNAFLAELKTRFSETLTVPAVKRSFLPNQSAEDIFERSRIYGHLVESLGGLQWIRFIDSGGARLHFSTYSPDILNQDRLSVSYRNLSEPGLSYDEIAAGINEEVKYTFDEASDRILFSFPFFDSFDVYRGTAVFSLSVQSLVDKLIQDGRIKVGQGVSVISDPPGFLSGVSGTFERSLAPQVSLLWKEGRLRAARLVSPDSGVALTLISVESPGGFFVGRLVNDEIFTFTQTMKIILLASFFLTVYLTTFLLFNLRQDSVTVVQNRLKQLQISLIEQYYEHKGEMDWNRWRRELEQRREEIGVQLKRGIKTAAGEKGKAVDLLIDKSWDELLSVIGGHKDSSLDADKLQSLLNRLLSALPESGAGTPIQISARSVSPAAAPAANAENIEEAPPLDEVETLEEAADSVEELEPLEEAESADEAESAELGADTPDESEAAELVESAEAEDELIEEAPPLDEVVALEEAAESVEELEPLEEAESADEAESAELGADTPDESEAAELVESAEAEDELIEETPPLDEAETFEEAADSVEELEPPEEAESAELGADTPDETEAAELVESADAEDEIIEEAPPLEEIPVIDTADMNISSADADAVLQALDSEDGIEELEELDEFEDAGEIEDFEEASSRENLAASSASTQDIGSLASQIEFNPEIGQEVSESESLKDDLEIASPFSTMFSGFSFSGDNEQGETPYDDDDAVEAEPEEAAAFSQTEAPPVSPVEDETDISGEQKNAFLEEETNRGFSLLYKPSFGASPDEAGIETLEPLPEEDDKTKSAAENSSGDSGVIREREGVHYIDETVLKSEPEPESSLDPDFKNLVDSIIK